MRYEGGKEKRRNGRERDVKKKSKKDGKTLKTKPKGTNSVLPLILPTVKIVRNKNSRFVSTNC